MKKTVIALAALCVVSAAILSCEIVCKTGSEAVKENSNNTKVFNTETEREIVVTNIPEIKSKKTATRAFNNNKNATKVSEKSAEKSTSKETSEMQLDESTQLATDSEGFIDKWY